MPGGERVLGRQSVVDRDHPHAVALRHLGVGDVVHPRAAHDHGPTVEVQVRPARAARRRTRGTARRRWSRPGLRATPARARPTPPAAPRAVPPDRPVAAAAGDRLAAVHLGDGRRHRPCLVAQPLVLLRPEHARIVRRPAGTAALESWPSVSAPMTCGCRAFDPSPRHAHRRSLCSVSASCVGVSKQRGCTVADRVTLGSPHVRSRLPEPTPGACQAGSWRAPVSGLDRGALRRAGDLPPSGTPSPRAPRPRPSRSYPLQVQRHPTAVAVMRRDREPRVLTECLRSCGSVTECSERPYPSIVVSVTRACR